MNSVPLYSSSSEIMYCTLCSVFILCESSCVQLDRFDVFFQWASCIIQHNQLNTGLKALHLQDVHHSEIAGACNFIYQVHVAVFWLSSAKWLLYSMPTKIFNSLCRSSQDNGSLEQACKQRSGIDGVIKASSTDCQGGARQWQDTLFASGFVHSHTILSTHRYADFFSSRLSPTICGSLYDV